MSKVKVEEGLTNEDVVRRMFDISRSLKEMRCRHFFSEEMSDIEYLKCLGKELTNVFMGADYSVGMLWDFLVHALNGYVDEARKQVVEEMKELLDKDVCITEDDIRLWETHHEYLYLNAGVLGVFSYGVRQLAISLGESIGLGSEKLSEMIDQSSCITFKE